MADTYWKTQERRIKRLLESRGWDAARQPGSGNLPHEHLKGDVYGEYGDFRLLVDHKSTRGEKSLSIQRADLKKHIEQAEAIDAFPITTFSYKGKHDLYGVVPLEVLLDLLESRETVLERLEGLVHVQ